MSNRKISSLKHVRVFGFGDFVYEHIPKSKVNHSFPSLFIGRIEHDVHTFERLDDMKIMNSVQFSFDGSVLPGLNRKNQVVVANKLVIRFLQAMIIKLHSQDKVFNQMMMNV